MCYHHFYTKVSGKAVCVSAGWRLMCNTESGDVPGSIERFCFSHFKLRSKQMLDVTSGNAVGWGLFLLVQRRCFWFFNLFTCVGSAKIPLQLL